MHVCKLYVADDGSRTAPRSAAARSRQDAESAGLPIVTDAEPRRRRGASTAPAGRRTRAANAPPRSGQRRRGQPDRQAVRALGARRRQLRRRPERRPRSNACTSRRRAFCPRTSPRRAGVRGRFTPAYGHAPAPQAIFGYEAMSALLSALNQARRRRPTTGRRSSPTSAACKNRRTRCIGTYSITRRRHQPRAVRLRPRPGRAAGPVHVRPSPGLIARDVSRLALRLGRAIAAVAAGAGCGSRRPTRPPTEIPAST